jgi:hypothetical protein
MAEAMSTGGKVGRTVRSAAKASVVLGTLTALIAVGASIHQRRAHASSNVARGCRVTASSSYETGVPGNAVDGDPTTQWNAGHLPPAWIELDLGRPYSVDRVTLVVEQTPAGPTVHDVYFGAESRSFALVETLSRQTVDGQELSFAPNSGRRGVRYVKVETTSSPSWVAWSEIEVWGTSQ